MLATSALRTTFVMFAKWHRVRNISEVRDDPSADDSEKLSDARLFGDSSGLLKCSFIFYQSVVNTESHYTWSQTAAPDTHLKIFLIDLNMIYFLTDV